MLSVSCGGQTARKPSQGRYLPPVIEEVVLEDLLGRVFMIKHFGIEGGNFLRGQAQLQGFA